MKSRRRGRSVRNVLSASRAVGLPELNPENPLRIGGYFLHDPDGRASKNNGSPIFVVNGAYLSGGRVSNHWYWRLVRPDGSLDAGQENGPGNNSNYFMPVSRRTAISAARRLAKEGASQ